MARLPAIIGRGLSPEEIAQTPPSTTTARSGLRRNTPMKRSGIKRSTTRILPISARRAADAPARRAATAEVQRRDGGCVFLRYIKPILPTLSDKDRQHVAANWRHRGKRHMHEMAHSRNVDRNDPDNGLDLCDGHNQFCEDFPWIAYPAGLLIKGNGLPLRKGVAS